MVGELDSDDAHVCWLLMLMVLHFLLTIWSSLVFAGLGVSVWSLLLLSLSCFRSPGRPVALAIADLLWRLLTVGSSEEPSSCCPVRSCSLGGAGAQTVVSVSLCAVELQGGFQSVVSVALHAVDPLGNLQSVGLVAQLPCVQRNYCDAF